ncbi:MAG TPA: PAS domain S-box protein [Bacteroidia bacterium]|nr:PAS domain S-box protein [Bacteroidia bacterium]
MLVESKQKSGQELLNRLDFKYLPDYAAYLSDNKLTDMSIFQLHLSRKLEIPLLKYFDKLSEDQLIEIGIQGIQKMLDYLKRNDAKGFIEESLSQFANNLMPVISRNQVVTDDVLLVSQVRSETFREFLSGYTTSAKKLLQILSEAEQFITILNLECLKVLFEIQQHVNKRTQSIAKIGNWVWDIQQDKMVWSEELFKIYELEPKEVVNYNYEVTTFNHPDDRERVDEQIRMSRETLKPHDFLYRIILPSGKQKTLRAIGEVTPGPDGKAIKMVGTVQDVTQLQEKSEQILLGEQRYHKMIEEVQDYAIILLSPDGIIENWNLGAEKIKGYRANEIVGKHIREFYTQNDREIHLPETLLEQARREGRAYHEGWRVKKNGQLFWGSVVITALHGSNGKVVGFTKVTRDLTFKKAAEDRIQEYSRQLEIRNQELQETYKEMESFSYVASHDLQEPLRKIKTFAGRIVNTESLSDKGKDYFGRITDATERMQALINDLLEYSRSNNSTAVVEEVDLNQVVREVCENQQEMLEEKEATVNIGKLPVISGIPLQMSQLFSNIIGNSIKYSRKDTPLVIDISYEKTDGQEINDKGKTYNHITISDNGIGFEQQYSNKIFELFQRLHNREEYSGTGIGLAICKKIVQNHGGAITGVGNPGKGATFNIYLPEAAAGNR